MAEEVKKLLNKGYAKDTAALKSLGYPQAIEFLEGKITRVQAIEKIIILTRQYAKRQRTWFNRYKNVLEIKNPADWPPEKLASIYLKN